MAKSIISNNPAQLVTKSRANLKDWVNDGNLTITSTGTTPTKGTVVRDVIEYRRVGDSADIKFSYEQSASGVNGSGDYLYTLPDGLSFDSNKILFSTGTVPRQILGSVHCTNSTSSSANQLPGYVVPYDATRFRIILQIDASANLSDQTSFHGNGKFPLGSVNIILSGEFTAPIAEWSGSDVTFLSAQPTQRVAYLKEVQPSGTNGGTATSGSYATRTLNAIEGDSEFVSLSSNQFTLQKGKYEIEAITYAYQVNSHHAKIRNITDSSDEILGNTSYAGATSAQMTPCTILGQLEIVDSKTFELQHRVETTVATVGLGNSHSFGVDEIYSQVKITKLK